MRRVPVSPLDSSGSGTASPARCRPLPACKAVKIPKAWPTTPSPRRSRRVVTAVFDRTAAEAVSSTEVDPLAGLTPETADAMRQLTGDQREIVFLRLVADLPIEEVAGLTGRSIGAVKAMQHRALASMRKEISRGAVSR